MKQIIKPCPFCGGKADVFRIPENTPEELATHPDWRWNHPGKWVIGCWETMSRCFGDINHVTMVFETDWEAIETWNQRAGEEGHDYKNAGHDRAHCNHHRARFDNSDDQRGCRGENQTEEKT